MTTATKTNHYLKTLAALAVSAIAAGSMMAYSAMPAHAAPQTFTVNTGGISSGAGTCTAIECTLNEAIDVANANPGKDTINFDIPGGAGSRLITPLSELPTITDPVIINGYSQPGAQENTLATGGTNAVIKIWLNGSDTNDTIADGLRIGEGGANSEIRGLAITDFTDGISVTDPAGVEIEGNFVGVEPSGTTARENKIVGLRIGTDISDPGGTTVGGTSPAARNVISGNASHGVVIVGDGDGHEVLGNLIGTDRDGTADLGNGEYGVWVLSTSPSGGQPTTNVGDGTSAGANTIAFNDKGVVVSGSNNVGNRILSNSIFSNGGPGIDLDNDGPTLNDTSDADSGANGLQNFPVLESAESGAGQTVVKGELNSSKSNQVYKIQFFSNPSGTDEGKKLLGAQNVTLNSSGNASFTFTATQASPTGENITATATDPAGNTSEFSAPVEVESGGGGNAAPNAGNDAYNVKPGKVLKVSAPGVLKNDSNPNGDSLHADRVSGPKKGAVTLNDNGSFSYKPKKSFKKGADTFTYKVSDGKGGTDTATVTLKMKKKK